MGVVISIDEFKRRMLADLSNVEGVTVRSYKCLIDCSRCKALARISAVIPMPPSLSTKLKVWQVLEVRIFQTYNFFKPILRHQWTNFYPFLLLSSKMLSFELDTGILEATPPHK